MLFTLPRMSSKERTNSIYVVSVTGAVALTTTMWYFIRRRKNRFGSTDVCSKEAIKQGFSMRKIPKDLDMIIIGSGMGGMTLGSIMAKEGKKVLILEQHDVVGGNTHTFEENGYEFDTGLHYVGGMGERKRWFGFTTDLRRWFDYITNGNVEWEKMDDEYDVAIVQGPNETSPDAETFTIPSEWSNLIPKLKRAFPDDTKAIDMHFQLLRRVETVAIPIIGFARVLPRTFANFIHRCIASRFDMFHKTAEEVLESLTSNKKLQGVLSYCYGDYGEQPSRGAFLTHAILWTHFQEGGYYPVGGPSVIARSVVPVIEKSGGKVLVRAPVSSILIDESNKAIGVEVKGKKILAPIVVSTVGAPLTYNKLVPKRHHQLLSEEHCGLQKENVKSKMSLMSLFVGMEGTAEELHLPKQNFWVFPSWGHKANWEAFEQDTTCMPAVFISFPSVKDPSFRERHPNKQVALVIAPSLFEDVEEFSSGRVKHRGEAYEAKKARWRDALMKIFLKQFPQLESKVRYTDVGTAASNDFYLGTHRGAVYGLGHTPERFQQTWLHPTTPFKNLFLSGQDVAFCGISGAMAGGFMTAAAIDKTTLLTILSMLAGS